MYKIQNKRKDSQIAHPLRKGEQAGSPRAGLGEQVGVEFLLVVPRLPDDLLFGVGEPKRFLQPPPRSSALLRGITAIITRTSYRGLGGGGSESEMLRTIPL